MKKYFFIISFLIITVILLILMTPCMTVKYNNYIEKMNIYQMATGDTFIESKMKYPFIIIFLIISSYLLIFIELMINIFKGTRDDYVLIPTSILLFIASIMMLFLNMNVKDFIATDVDISLSIVYSITSIFLVIYSLTMFLIEIIESIRNKNQSA